MIKWATSGGFVLVGAGLKFSGSLPTMMIINAKWTNAMQRQEEHSFEIVWLWFDMQMSLRFHLFGQQLMLVFRLSV